MKWAGLVGCELVFVAWILSVTLPVRWIRGEAAIILNGGGILWTISDGYANRSFTTWMLGGPSSVMWLPRSSKNWSSGFSGAGSVFVPIWCMLLPVAIPTYILWRRDRPKPEGCCQECGYDLTGNESGVCSECGKPI